MKKQKTCSLYVRNFPNELRWKCKEAAARERMELAPWIIKVLSDALAKSDTKK